MFAGHHRAVFAGLVLVAIVVLAAVSARTGLPGVVALAAVSVLWLLVNGSAEGAVLWTLSRSHGLTETDLAGLAGLGVAVCRARQLTRRRRGDQHE
jgi:hypothetical protein